MSDLKAHVWPPHNCYLYWLSFLISKETVVMEKKNTTFGIKHNWALILDSSVTSSVILVMWPGLLKSQFAYRKIKISPPYRVITEFKWDIHYWNVHFMYLTNIDVHSHFLYIALNPHHSWHAVLSRTVLHLNSKNKKFF